MLIFISNLHFFYFSPCCFSYPQGSELKLIFPISHHAQYSNTSGQVTYRPAVRPVQRKAPGPVLNLAVMSNLVTVATAGIRGVMREGLP